MNLLNPSLKIITSILSLILLSCTTIKSDAPLDVKTYSSQDIPIPIIKRVYTLSDKPLAFGELSKPTFKIPLKRKNIYIKSEPPLKRGLYSINLTTPKIIKPVVKEKKRVVTTKPRVESKVAVKPAVVKSNPPVKTTEPAEEVKPVNTDKESNLEASMEKETLVTTLDTVYIELGKRFTIEMDQTGWLYTDNNPDINFHNKFYTSKKVIFEFSLNGDSKTDVEFVKYGSEGSETARIPIAFNSIAKEDDNIIEPDITVSHLSVREKLEKRLENIKYDDNPEEVYFKLAEIYFEDSLIKKSRELYLYIANNYPFGEFGAIAEERVKYIDNNFFIAR